MLPFFSDWLCLQFGARKERCSEGQMSPMRTRAHIQKLLFAYYYHSDDDCGETLYRYSENWHPCSLHQYKSPCSNKTCILPTAEEAFKENLTKVDNVHALHTGCIMNWNYGLTQSSLLRINFISKGKQTDFGSDLTGKSFLTCSEVFSERQKLGDGFINFSPVGYHLNVKLNCSFWEDRKKKGKLNIM